MMRYKKSIASDTSITSLQHYSYLPYSQSYGNNDEIRIAIQSQSAYLLPSDSQLYIEGVFNRAADTEANAPNPYHIANFAAFLFDSIRYEINGTEIDKCKNVGITSTLKTYTSITESELRGLHTASLGVSDECTPGEQFSLVIPLRLYMGFFEDYKSIIMNARNELLLNRRGSDIHCFTTANNAANNYTILSALTKLCGGCRTSKLMTSLK